MKYVKISTPRDESPVKVAIPETRREWEVFSFEAAMALTDAIVACVRPIERAAAANRGVDAVDLAKIFREHVLPVAMSHADDGACDTEPEEHVARALRDIAEVATGGNVDFSRWDF